MLTSKGKSGYLELQHVGGMKRPARKKSKIKRFQHAPPGTAPGMINVRQDALVPQIRYWAYDAEGCQEVQLNTLQELKSIMQQSPDKVKWVDIHGFGDHKFMEYMADYFGIHRLQMEDVVNVYQRPKAEDNPNNLFLISRAIRESEAGLMDDQISIFLGKNFVLTFQERYEDILNPLRERIRKGKGQLRSLQADYLAYAIMDVVLDNFYPILEHLGDKLDELQDELLSNPTKSSLDRVLFIKRELILLRRIIWSERDKLNDILRSNFSQIGQETKIYLRDSYDHCIQILDLVESYREVTASLMDVYHSSVSNKLNQVMKVLTIISTIFIPLTFIVGLYGMNFAEVDPISGRQMPWNMPELYHPYGYVIVVVIMIVIVLLQLIFFFKKGWLTKG